MGNSKSSFQFDVFISYSHKDINFVKNTLLPKLGSFGNISYAIDYKDFYPGQLFESEMIRLIEASRKILIVMTQNWIESNFTDFEAQVSRALDPKGKAARLLILKLEPCETPDLLKNLGIIDLVNLGENTAWKKLYETLIIEISPPVRFEAVIDLWRDYLASVTPGYMGYQYSVQILVANPTPGFKLVFDSIRLTPVIPKSLKSQRTYVDAIRIYFAQDKKSVAIQFSYRGHHNFEDTRLESAIPETIMLEGERAIKLPNLGLGLMPPSIAGQEAVGLSMCLWRGNYQITQNCWCVLPPLSRLQQVQEEGYHIYLFED